MLSALPRDEHAAKSEGVELTLGGVRGTDAAPTRISDQELQNALPHLVEVRCECGQSNCISNIVMSLREYESVRRHPMHFLIKEGHEVADLVRVVGYGTEYVVVAKLEADAFSAIGGL